MWKPCGNTIIPVAKLRTSLPLSSNFRITGNATILLAAASQQEFAPQRSPTHTDLPSLSISTALSEPQTRPSGILKKFSIVV